MWDEFLYWVEKNPSMAVSYLALLVSVVAALWTARSLKVIRELVDTANIVSKSAKKQSERSNESAAEASWQAKQADSLSVQALEHQQQLAPPEWSVIDRVDGETYQVVNSSGQDITVLDVTSVPDRRAAMFKTVRDTPVKVSYGDRLTFVSADSVRNQTESVEIRWHYVNDSAERATVTTRNMP